MVCVCAMAACAAIGLNCELLSHGEGCALVHWRLVVHWSPAHLLDTGQAMGMLGLLEEEDMWFWLVDFVVLPAQTLCAD